jgi:hypothetical protein
MNVHNIPLTYPKILALREIAAELEKPAAISQI